MKNTGTSHIPDNRETHQLIEPHKQQIMYGKAKQSNQNNSANHSNNFAICST